MKEIPYNHRIALGDTIKLSNYEKHPYYKMQVTFSELTTDISTIPSDSFYMKMLAGGYIFGKPQLTDSQELAS